MGLIRWRHQTTTTPMQYPNGDLGRVQTQQAFLKAVAAECLKPEILLKVTSLAEIFMENVSTDLSLGNLLAFAQLAMGDGCGEGHPVYHHAQPGRPLPQGVHGAACGG